MVAETRTIKWATRSASKKGVCDAHGRGNPRSSRRPFSRGRRDLGSNSKESLSPFMVGDGNG